VREYWIVDPEARTIEILVLAADRYQLHGTFRADETVASVVLPGLSVAVGTVCRDT
jgi:Uma2 family endonuclease